MFCESNNILDCYPEYDAKIGIEVHVQLKTKSKIFCPCPNIFGDIPNKNVCPICAGYPGTLPVLNKKVIDFAIMLGIATESKISKFSEFARKHYIYPDLPKNFQITQDDKPLCQDGHIPIELEDYSEKKIRLVRIHVEEDAGKNIHTSENTSLIDLNRAGTPLLEIVSQPDIDNSVEAKVYLSRLKTLVEYLDIRDANMEEGSFRGDINISIKKKNDKKLGTRVELKNINSFKFITQSINYEIERQIKMIELGEKVKQETRLWDEKSHQTIFMRSKEEAFDYRYFTEPDLPVIVVDDVCINRLKKSLPELPHKKLIRFIHDYGLTRDESTILTSNLSLSKFFEKTASICKRAKQACNWILRNYLAYIKEHKIEISECKIKPETLAELILEIDQEIINTKTAQDVFDEMASTGKYPSIIVQEKGLKQISSVEKLEPIIKKIIEDNPKQVEQYKSGNERLFAFFVGQTMKATQGKANPQIVNKLLRQYL